MSWNNKVIWSEGMFLQPQHFQQHDRYLEQLLENRTTPLLAYSWGFSTLELNTSLLSQGKIQLNAAKGIFPDGTPFDFPLHDKPPLPLEIKPDVRDEQIVLALPLRRNGAYEASINQTPDNIGNLTRFSIEEIEITDTTTHINNNALLQIGQLQMRLMRKQDATDAYTILGVVEIIERKTDNQLVLNKNYIPPILTTHVSASLTGYIQELNGQLQQCGDNLASIITQPGYKGTAEIAHFLKLLVINRYEPLLKHIAAIPFLHPERLFSLYLQLVGDLSTFSEQHRPNGYPAYEHDSLEKCFEPLMKDLNLLISQQGELNTISIELQDRHHGYWLAIVHDKHLFKSASFILAVNAQLPSEAIRANIPTHIKIGPVEKVRDLVNSALPGVPLNPLPVAPRQLPFHAGFNYFELEQRNELWHSLEHSAGLGMFIQGEWPGLQLELWAIKG